MTEDKQEIYPFFTLSRARLAAAMLDAAKPEDLDEDQMLYLRAALQNIAHVSTTVMAEEASLNGSTAARKFSPASSRAMRYEQALYGLLEKGDAEAVRQIARPQEETLTAHPNFSRSRALVKDCQELSETLGDLDRASQHRIQTTGELAGNDTQKITRKLADMKKHLKPRTQRSRREELEETVLDFIPIARKAASETIDIVKIRKARLCGGQGEKRAEFASVAQLDAMAELLPTYNSWFSDGDGKRTSHVYDAEMAIPAMKRATMEGWQDTLDSFNKLATLKSLGRMPDEVKRFVDNWHAELDHAIKVLGEVEELATARMEALNLLHSTHAKAKITDNQNAHAEYDDAWNAAQGICLDYMRKLHERIAEDGKTVIDLLRRDTAKEFRAQLGTLLESAYAGKLSLNAGYRELAEDLYIQLAHFKNFTVRPQRRENAKEYRIVFEYLVQNNHDFRKALAEKLDVHEGEIMARLLNPTKPQFYTQAVEAFAQLAAAEPEKINAYIVGSAENVGSYKGLASKLEKILKNNGNGEDETMVIQPLKEDEFLTLDALGYFNMARLYPEAFKGGFVIAEFAQPHITVLRKSKKNPQETQAEHENRIRDEVVRLARTDMLLNVAFARAMGAPNVPVMGLHEDPSTMLYAPDAQAALRDPLMVDYLLGVMGVTGDEAEQAVKAEALAMRYLDEKGRPKPLTHYQLLRRDGLSDAQMEEEGLDIKLLKKTYILEGPDDMEACSDNSKRASIIGAELAEESVREKRIAQARLAAAREKSQRRELVIGGRHYIIINPKYYGQGGSIARATGSPADAEQVTGQGEQALNYVPKSLAHETNNKMLARLTMTQEAALGVQPPIDGMLYRLAADSAAHYGNALGLPGHRMDQHEKALMKATIAARIASTRDDARYDRYLETYGGPTLNYSARANTKSGDPEFGSKRAIGVAGEETPIHGNVIGTAELFQVGNGEARLEPAKSAVETLRGWKAKDTSLQHRLPVAGLDALFASPEEAWLRGGIRYGRSKSGAVELTKDNCKIALHILAETYNKTEIRNGRKVFVESYKDPKTGVTFGADDLVMAHLTEQYLQLEKGLLTLYGKKSLIDIFPKSQQEDIRDGLALQKDILKRLNKTKPAKGEKKTAGRELLEGAYYLVFESGGLLPLAQLLEQELYRGQDAAVTR